MIADGKPGRNSVIADEDTKLKEGVDYYLENGLFVFTAAFLLKRGHCCESGCRHCPYGYSPASQSSDSPDMR